MVVQFIKCPTGRYNLAYDVGEIITVTDAQGMDMITDGYAIFIRNDVIETAMATPPKEKRTKK